MAGRGEPVAQGLQLAQHRGEPVGDHVCSCQKREIASTCDIPGPPSVSASDRSTGCVSTPASTPTTAALPHAEGIEVVPALEHHQSAARRHPFEQSLGDGDVVARRKAHLGDRIEAVRVESRRHDQPRRLEGVHPRGHDLVDRVQVDVAGRAGWQRDVHRVPQPQALARVGVPARTRVQRPLVEADEQHARVGVEHVLRAVAVMRVVVDDEHALALRGERRGDDSDVRDEAEPHRHRAVRVVPRRSHRTERRVPFAPTQCVDSGEPRPGRQRGRPPGARARVRVGVETTAAAGADLLDAIEVRGRVHALEILTRRGDRLERNQRVDVGVTLHTRQHGLQSFGPFGVSRAGQVLEVRGMGTEQHGHVCDATVQCE